ncbi:hypothetical protein [Nocardioides aurantiacus]|uniref:Uncharacterized protein n=1 Tax=Nocardioides aurantiacus TaxID=86796 RepID=A0A3N2CUD1_9ACTN|nr:hypothetical protein [Nocardioides aurantiacus]ROR91140.1 hypothetical protein EDD33_2001 [Nocardioides aurantiacus]
MLQNDLLEATDEGTTADEPSLIMFTDEDGVDVADDVELLKLTSASLGAIVARRC